jgi:hypothetical protein
MEDHLVAHAVVEDDGKPVERDRPLQHDYEVAEEFGEVSPRCREPRTGDLAPAFEVAAVP